MSTTAKKILIGEDEPLIAEHLRSTLVKLGYEISGIGHTEAEIYQLLKSKPVDLILLDINLEGHFEGIRIGAFIRDYIQKPFIYVTAHSDRNTFTQALSTRPSSYLVKPFKAADIFTSVELALHAQDVSLQPNGEGKKEHIFVNVKGSLVKVLISDILFARAEGNYTSIFLLTGRYLLRGNLLETLNNHLDDRFIRVHKSFAVNSTKISSIGQSTVNILGEQIPLGRSYKAQLMEKMR